MNNSGWMAAGIAWTCVIVSLFAAPTATTAGNTALVRVSCLRGGLTPKSIAWNGHGLFFAQNMMYRHTMTVFDDQLQRCGTIDDRVELEELGIRDRPGSYRGAPVECVFTADGHHAYVSNYLMEGEGYTKPGCDKCHGVGFDGSFVYRINTATLMVDAAYPTGSVPKYLALTPDERMLLVANWSSGDVSLIDLTDNGCEERIAVGRFPRGLAVDPKGLYAYVAIMGGTAIKRIDLHTHAVDHFATVGDAPRHLSLDREGKILYASLNNEGAIARIDIATRKVDKLRVGATPRSMAFGRDEQSLYVVNYVESQLVKVDLSSFTVTATAPTDVKPIGITYDACNQRIWVACYSGSILIFEDRVGMSALLHAPGVANNAPKPKEHCEVFAVTRKAQKTSFAEVSAAASVTEPSQVPTGTHLVIAGCFRERANAERHVQRLKALGFPAIIHEASTESGLHQVVAGSFGSEQETKHCYEKLARSSIPAWIKRR